MNLFDVIGPVMIGPSSSHTAGAVRIGAVSRSLLGSVPKSVEITVHGSFARTGKGHGTFPALLGGVLGFGIDDINIRNSFAFAAKEQVRVTFYEEDLGLVHPNTAQLNLTGADGSHVSVLASSVGGGRIQVNRIDGYEVSFSAELDTLAVFYADRPGVLAGITSSLSSFGVNIAYMRVSRKSRGEQAVMVCETDQEIPEECLSQVRGYSLIQRAVYVPPLRERVLS